MSTSARSGFWAGLLAGAITTVVIYLGLFETVTILGTRRIFPAFFGAPLLTIGRGPAAVAVALWERVLRLIPMELFSFLIVRMKFAAKPVAFWGMLIVLTGVWGVVGAAAIGWFSPRRAAAIVGRVWLLAAGLLTLLALRPAVAYLSAWLMAEGGEEVALAGVFVPVLVAILGYGLLFAVLFTVFFRILPRGVAPLYPLFERITRRELLSRALILIAASVAGTLGAHWAQGAARRATAVAQTLFARIRELPAEITPNAQFYVVSKNPPGFDPTLDVRKWSLEVGGLVARPRRFSYDELRTMPAVDQVQTLECISNEVGGDLMSTAKWRGVRLRDVLGQTGGPGSTAVQVAFRCADGYSESIPVGEAMNPSTILAYEMNGEPLPTAHGFPLRLLIPGLYGMKNPKWITKIEVVSYDFQGYWEASGWSDEAVVKTMSKFNTAARTQHLGEIDLGGVAYGGDRSVKEVEVSFDGGNTWQKAERRPPIGPFTWVLWAVLWKPSAPGEYTLKVRARDGLGILQTARETPTLPDGASGYHTLRVRVLK